MISKHIGRKPENDNYRALALYTGAASHEQEKLLFRWHEGCASDEFDLAIREVEAVQRMNTRTVKEKTYHLMVSFRPEDESRLTEAILKDIEREFAAALGFGEHQRHCGVHKNTANMHMHVAYNMIHPEKLTRYEPYRDYFKRDQVCRQLEQKYGLTLDVQESAQERAQTQGPRRGNDKARTLEAHSSQQSFDGYVQEHRELLSTALAQARTWKDFHAGCAQIGVEVVLRNNGCVFKDRYGKHAVKCSSVGRQFSKGALEKILGPFAASTEQQPARQRYTTRPLQKEAESSPLYEEYKGCLEARQTALRALEEESKKRAEAIRQLWAEHKQRIETASGLTRRDKWSLLKKTSEREQAELEAMRVEIQARRVAIREATPFWNWAGFLQNRARGGDEAALAQLRWRGEEVRPEAETAPRVKSDSSRERLKVMRLQSQEEREQISKRRDMTASDRQGLLAVSRMRQLVAEDKLVKGKSALEGFTWTVDAKGVVLFHLPNGGVIRDTGKGLSYSVHDPLSKDIAQRLAVLKFGRYVQQKDNTFSRKQSRSLER